MPTPDLESVTADSLDTLEVTDELGQPVARVGLTMTLYLEDPHKASVRQKAAECIDEYILLVREHLRWGVVGEQRPRDISHQPFGPMTDVARALPEAESFEMAATGAEAYHQASHYNLHALLGRHRPFRRLGYVSASLPFRFLLGRPAGFFQQLVHAWCCRLSPFHGYAGLGLLRSMEGSEARAIEPLVFPLVKRFPGLEIEMPHLESRLLSEGIKGVNWLTIVGDPLLEKVGGQKALIQSLGNDFIFHPYPGGLMIQAGPQPEFGDLERNMLPVHYCQLYEVLRPLQAQYDDILMDTPEGVEPEEFTRQWLRRFAGPRRRDSSGR
ncbi:DUF3396 domain-containing protein [Archangium violaceum]|uniref:type VI immunity family protein n=1 Tax=Archangium violaceum TaxID=83451 RepID=UPI00193BAD4D|nr:type VI immunity family protein [Archangium violaceum]QRK05091.1 DUF3396 domain-containing protein [Archangium violaceum]